MKVLVAMQAGALRDGLLALLTVIPRITHLEVVANLPAALDRANDLQPALTIIDGSLLTEDDHAWRYRLKLVSAISHCIILANTVQQQRAIAVRDGEVVLLKGAAPAEVIAIVEEVLAHTRQALS